MHYLKTYPDSIGISHYLCWRMKAMPAEEVEFYWPQIWYVRVRVWVCVCISAVLAYSPECNHTCDILKAAWGSKPWIKVFHPARARYSL
jgi:hypothetical protein